jgi:hypothetical protein
MSRYQSNRDLNKHKDWGEQKGKRLNCLKCDKEFKSYGKFNRLCLGCREKNLKTEELVPAIATKTRRPICPT